MSYFIRGNQLFVVTFLVYNLIMDCFIQLNLYWAPPMYQAWIKRASIQQRISCIWSHAPSSSTLAYSQEGKTNIEQITNDKGNVYCQIQGVIVTYRSILTLSSEWEGSPWKCGLQVIPEEWMNRNLPSRTERVAPKVKEGEGDQIIKDWVKDLSWSIVKATGNH